MKACGYGVGKPDCGYSGAALSIEGCAGERTEEEVVEEVVEEMAIWRGMLVGGVDEEERERRWVGRGRMRRERCREEGK